MNDATAPPDSKVQFLAELMQALESADDRQAVIERYCAQRPDLAEELRALADVNQVLDVRPADKEPPMPERLGEFRVLRRIGRGGMGEIYEGEQQSLDGRRVAIKVIRHGRVSPEARTRFLREQRVLARLHQTHIVPIHTAGEEGDLQYFVMPYIEGAALHHVVRAAYDETLREAGKTPTVKELASQLSAESSQPLAPRERGRGEGLPPTTGPAASGRVPSATVYPRPGSIQRLPDRGECVSLSQPYFRSVAEVMADAAEAVQHAHDAGFVHRDLKPSNIMVDAAGQCWIIDFGLAGYVSRKPEGPPRSARVSDPAETPDRRSPLAVPAETGRPSVARTAGSGTRAEPLTRAEPEPVTTGLLGTPHYMAPEQVDGKADRLSDVWGLGATLYELCTLRRPFEADSVKALQSQILSDSPPPPRGLVRNLPGDLAAICLKSLQKDPAKRYRAAGDFAADLRRWLRHEPTVARPARTPRRLWLWSRRNPGWAAMIITAALAAVLLCGAAIAFAQMATQESERRAKDAEELAEQQRWQTRFLELQRAREIIVRKNGWRKSILDGFAELARPRPAFELRNQAAATLAGIDANRERVFQHSASSVVFHPHGQGLLMGGLDKQPARLWDGSLHEPLDVGLTGPGPVAFTPDGIPLQLALNKVGAVLLREIGGNKPEREFKLPTTGDVTTLALAPDGTRAAAAIRMIDGENKSKRTIAVWETATGKLLTQLERPASALAFSPDAMILAAGDDDGTLTLWKLPEGALLATFRADRASIMALSFGPDPRRQTDMEKTAWLLAAGDGSGTITIWDVQAKIPRANCRGSSHHVHAVAFSLDGTTLASVGREFVKLWDVSSGKSLLDIAETNWLTGVAFSPDGRRLAVSSAPAFREKGQVTILSVQNGSGVQTLRGLAGQIEQVVFSSDERLVAAVSHDSRVGVWDVKADKLLHVFEAPRTDWVDNAGLAFSADSRQLAYSGSRGSKGHAVVWSIKTGKELNNWSFDAGLHNILVFQPDKKLLLFQMEPRHSQPPVARMYELPPGKAPKSLWTLSEFNRGIDFPVAPADGRYVAMVGYFANNQMKGARRVVLKAFNAVTGEPLWQSEPEEPPGNLRIELAVDPAGKHLTVRRIYLGGGPKSHAMLLEGDTGKYLSATELHAGAGWGPSMPFWLDRHNANYWHSLALVPRDKKAPAVVLAIDPKPSGTKMSFNSDGSRFAWGNADGSVNVADLIEINRRLTEVGLEW
jgi:serine/threonine protein kinase/WD40 repeat protein